MKASWLSFSSLCAFSVAMGMSAPARAQTVDYGSLESAVGEPVTMSATGTPQRASDSPANMTIITADEIRQSGSRNIPEILSRVPGLDILQSGNNTFDVGVRGYQQPFQSRLLVLVDGRQVFIDDYSRTIWDNIPVNVDDIRQIEVVKGADSALFGSNAAGGVINIVTYSPLYDDNNVVSVTAGTQHTFSGDGTTTIKGAWGGSKTTVGGLNAQAFSTPRDNTGVGISSFDSDAQNPYHGYFANQSVFKISPGLSFSTEANYSASAGTVDDLIDNGQSAGQKTSTYSVGGGLSWDSPYGQVSFNNYLNHSLVQLYESPTDEGEPYGLTTNLFVSQLQDQFTVGTDHTFRTAFEYRYKDFKNDGVQVGVQQAPALAENTFALSGTWLWQINDRLSWTNAARVDHQELSETGTLLPGAYYNYSDYNSNLTAFTGNSDLVYKATDLDSFRLGYGRGVQFPSFLQYGFQQYYSFGYPSPADAAAAVAGGNANAAPVDFEGNPKLKPTYVQDYSLDYDRKVGDIYSYLKFSIYYELNQDIVGPFAISFTNPSLGTTTNIPGNIGNSQGWGGEVELKGNSPSGFRWDGSYSYSRVADSNAVADPSSFVDYQGSAPQHHFRLLLGYTTGPWEFDANGQLVTATDMLRGSVASGYVAVPVYTSGYTSLAARVGYRINDMWTFAISGTNLENNTTYVSPYPAIQRQIFGTLTGKF